VKVARVLRYVDEAAGAGEATVEQADVNVTAAINLRHAEAR